MSLDSSLAEMAPPLTTHGCRHCRHTSTFVSHTAGSKLPAAKRLRPGRARRDGWRPWTFLRAGYASVPVLGQDVLRKQLQLPQAADFGHQHQQVEAARRVLG